MEEYDVHGLIIKGTILIVLMIEAGRFVLFVWHG
jgi:hypothetical protein